MYRPSLYNKHDETMNNFAKLFNQITIYKNIVMRPNAVETYDNDGIIIDIETNRSIGYDWEYRDRYFANCKLDFDSLGQYERKIRKPSIQLSIQCDSTETGIAVGWHKDWLTEEREKRALKTDFSKKENGTLRYTTNFRIYRFDETDSFKRMVAQAIRLQVYSSKIFEMMEVTSDEEGNKKVTESTSMSADNTGEENHKSDSLKDFFISKGLNVVDNREKGGCLWVLGDKNIIDQYIREACNKFHISGSYGIGGETGYKPGWFTKPQI